MEAAAAGGNDEPPRQHPEKSSNPKSPAGRGQVRKRKGEEADPGNNADEGGKCSECDKSFPTKKALYGHMRSHPDRPWRGANPPPEARDEREGARGLLLLAEGSPAPHAQQQQQQQEAQQLQPQPKQESLGQDQGKPPQQPQPQAPAAPSTTAGGATPTTSQTQATPPARTSPQVQRQPSPTSAASSTRTHTTPPSRARIRNQVASPPPQAVGEEGSSSTASPAPSGDTAQFVCNVCQRVFDSYQALGGHRATHRNVRGCSKGGKCGMQGGDGDQPPQQPQPQEQPQPVQARPPPTHPLNLQPQQVAGSPHQFNLGIGAGSSTGGAGPSRYRRPLERQSRTSSLTYLHTGVSKVPLDYGCQLCDKKFPSGQALGGHMRWHIDRHEMPPPPALSSLGRGRSSITTTTTATSTTVVPTAPAPVPASAPRFGYHTNPFYRPPGHGPPGSLPVPPLQQPHRPTLYPPRPSYNPPFLDAGPSTRVDPVTTQSALDAARELAQAYDQYSRERERQRRWPPMPIPTQMAPIQTPMPTPTPGQGQSLWRYADLERYFKEVQGKLDQGAGSSSRGKQKQPEAGVVLREPFHHPQSNPLGPPLWSLPPGPSGQHGGQVTSQRELELFPSYEGHRGPVPPSLPTPQPSTQPAPGVLPQSQLRQPGPQIFGWRLNQNPQQQLHHRRQQQQQQQEEGRMTALWRRRTRSPSSTAGPSSSNQHLGPEDDNLRLQLKPPSPPPSSPDQQQQQQQQRRRREGDDDSHDKPGGVNLNLSLS